MVDDTIRTYDMFAEDYACRRADRSALVPDFDRFAALVGPGARTLDAGCGPAFDAVELRTRGLNTMGLDLSSGMLASARTRLAGNLVRGDLRAVPFRGTFAGVWACASLLHLRREDVPHALASLRCALAAGGWLYISMKSGTGETVESYPGADPQIATSRRFVFWEGAELDAALSTAGFTVVEAGDERPGRGFVWISRFARVATI